MKQKVEEKVHAIADALFFNMKLGTLDLPDCGLLSGRMGIIIFCEHYLRTYPTIEKSDILSKYVDAYFERLSEGVDYYPYCGGLTGILEGLKYLVNQQLIDVDYSELEINYKKALQQFSLYSIFEKNYDYLHGGLGVVKYFSTDVDFVNQALDALDETAIKDGDNYKWISRLGMEEKYGYNISLSHGISSIVSVLSILSHSGIDLEKRNRLLTGACNYILSQKINPKQYGCYFPSMSLENEPQKEIHCSRMGWCYGDLGIATSLWQAGKLLCNRNWQEQAIEIFTYSATRRDFQYCGIFDSGLCHGSASIYMMFHYMYIQTNNQLFKETRDYWLSGTLEMGNLDTGLAGYRAWNGEKQGYVNDYGILDGVAGIGLTLLSRLLNTKKEIKWLNFFLLN